MKTYQLYFNRDNELSCIICGSKSIPIDPDNTDYQEYLKWLSEGNEPEPADEMPT